MRTFRSARRRAAAPVTALAPVVAATLLLSACSTGSAASEGDPPDSTTASGEAAGFPVTLDNCGTEVTFEGVLPYATLQVREDPGEILVLVFAITVLMGIVPALTVKRRRIWVRVGPDGTSLGGLTRTEYDGFDEEFHQLADIIAGRERQPEKMGSLTP